MMKDHKNNILEKILLSEAKRGIIKEIEEKNLNLFPTLIPFSENMTKETKDGYDFVFQIKDLDVDVFLGNLNAKTIEEAQRNLNRYLYDDLKEIGDDDKSIVIEIDGDDKTISGVIKIETAQKKINDMKEIDEKNDCAECGETNEVKKPCIKCGKELNKLNEEKTCNKCENGSLKRKKVIKLTERGFIDLMEKIVKESVPGLEVVKAAHHMTKKHNDEYLTSVNKKIKKYLSFYGNDNPEFPNQINKGDKKARRNNSEEEEYVDDNRGGGMEDLIYEPSLNDTTKERHKKYLQGDSTTGNSPKALNVSKSDLGDKIMKKTERKKAKIKKEPMYVKDPQPVRNIKESSKISEDLEKFNKIAFYNKKTQ